LKEKKKKEEEEEEDIDIVYVLFFSFGVLRLKGFGLSAGSRFFFLFKKF